MSCSNRTDIWTRQNRLWSLDVVATFHILWFYSLKRWPNLGEMCGSMWQSCWASAWYPWWQHEHSKVDSFRDKICDNICNAESNGSPHKHTAIDMKKNGWPACGRVLRINQQQLCSSSFPWFSICPAGRELKKEFSSQVVLPTESDGLATPRCYELAYQCFQCSHEFVLAWFAPFRTIWHT